jgi:hypothetical protein
MIASVIRLPNPVPASAALRTPAPPARYRLRSKVRFRWAGRIMTGVIVGIAHGEPARYDIRRIAGGAGRNTSLPVSFGVPHEAVARVLALPPAEDVLVMTDMLWELRDRPAPVEPARRRRGIIAQLLRIGRAA